MAGAGELIEWKPIELFDGEPGESVLVSDGKFIHLGFQDAAGEWRESCDAEPPLGGMTQFYRFPAPPNS